MNFILLILFFFKMHLYIHIYFHLIIYTLDFKNSHIHKTCVKFCEVWTYYCHITWHHYEVILFVLHSRIFSGSVQNYLQARFWIFVCVIFFFKYKDYLLLNTIFSYIWYNSSDFFHAQFLWGFHMSPLD